MEEFQTSIFEKTKDRSRKRLIYNILIFGGVVGIWILLFLGLPFVGIKTAIGVTGLLLGMKLYDDRYMGITAHGVRKDKLVIAEQYLEIRDVRIPFTELTNLVIYVDEYLGMPKEIYGIHHGGNNKIEFDHNGMSVSINYVIKNKQDFNRVSKLVEGIEKNPELSKYLKKL